jgi:MFS family permease
MIAGGIVLILISVTWRTTLRVESKTVERLPLFALPDKSLLNLGVIAFCSMVCEGTMSDWSGIYFSKELHAPKELITIGYVAYLSCMTTGRFAGDHLINRFGFRKILISSGLFIATGSFLISGFTSMTTAIIGFMLCGFGVSCIMPFVFSNAGKTSSMPTGVAIAAVSTLGYLGFLTGPPLIGFLSNIVGLRYSFIIPIVLGLLISYLILKLKTNTLDLQRVNSI